MKEKKKKLAWIVTAIVVVAATLITPTGLKKERLKRAVDKYIAEDHSEESSKKEKKKEKKEEKVEEEPEEIEEVEEVVVEEDQGLVQNQENIINIKGSEGNEAK